MELKEVYALIVSGGVITGGAVVIIYFWWRAQLPARISIQLVRTEAVIWLIVLSYFAFQYVEHQGEKYEITTKPSQKP